MRNNPSDGKISAKGPSDGEANALNEHPRLKHSKLAMTSCGMLLLAASLFLVVPLISDGGSNFGAFIQWVVIAYAAAVVWGVAGVMAVISVILASRRRCAWFWPRWAIGLCLALPICFSTWLYWPTQERMVRAAGEGKRAYVELALRFGCDINAPMEYGLGFNPVSAPRSKGETALTQAVISRRDDMVRFLLEKGADPNRANGDRQTPLRLAEAIQEYSIALFLLKNGAVRIVTSEHGNHPVYTDQQVEAFRPLLDTVRYPTTPPGACAVLGIDWNRLQDVSFEDSEKTGARAVWSHARLSDSYSIFFHILVDPAAADRCDKVEIRP